MYEGSDNNNHIQKTWRLPHFNPALYAAPSKLSAQIEASVEKKMSVKGSNILFTLIANNGLNGTGKTQPILAFVHQQLPKYDHVVWFRAEFAEKLIQEYIDFAIEFGIVQANESLTIVEIQKRVKTWLEKNADKKFLFVYDNAESWPMLEPLLFQSNEDIIITSIAIDCDWPFHPILFEADKSKAFAAELALKVTDKPIEKLKLLAKRVDFQAYALVIAVAYIHHKQISVEEYLNLFDAHMHTSRKNRPISICLQIIYNEWKETDKPLIELLQFLAYLDPDRTPIEILQLLMFNNISLESYSSLNILLNKLAAFKLIEYQANTQFVKIHRSIQQALPLIESSDQQTTLIRLLGLISQQVLYPETMNIHFHSLLPNLIMLAQTIVLRGANLLSPQQKCQLSDWLYSAGQWYLNLGNLQMATSLTEQAFQMLTNTEAEDHNDMAIRYTNFAAAYQNLGDNSKFKSSLILAINNTYLNHTENLDVTITKISSDITKKIRSLENALKNFEAEHTVVAKNIKELIGYYNQTNQHEENIALLLRYQKHMQIKWGGGLTTINILTNLAISYGKLHQFEKEKDALIQVLEIYKRTHGEQDIQVAITLLQLAEVYQSLKNTDEQTNTLQAAWNIFQTKDANSINSFITALTLGKVCLQTKKPKEAAAILAEAATIHNKLNTSATQSFELFINLANAYLLTEQFAEALPVLQQAISLQNQLNVADKKSDIPKEITNSQTTRSGKAGSDASLIAKLGIRSPLQRRANSTSNIGAQPRIEGSHSSGTTRFGFKGFKSQ